MQLITLFLFLIAVAIGGTPPAPAPAPAPQPPATFLEGLDADTLLRLAGVTGEGEVLADDHGLTTDTVADNRQGQRPAVTIDGCEFEIVGQRLRARKAAETQGSTALAYGRCQEMVATAEAKVLSARAQIIDALGRQINAHYAIEKGQPFFSDGDTTATGPAAVMTAAGWQSQQVASNPSGISQFQQRRAMLEALLVAQEQPGAVNPPAPAPSAKAATPAPAPQPPKEGEDDAEAKKKADARAKIRGAGGR